MTCLATCHSPAPSQAHCGVCHRSLASVSDFDRHRRRGACLDPASLGLVEVFGLWASPERHSSDFRKAAVLASVRLRGLPTPPDASGSTGGPSVSSKINNADLPLRDDAPEVGA